MQINRLIRAASIIGVAVLLAASAAATTVTYNTNAAGTGFGGASLVLNSTGGDVPSLLTFTPNGDTITGVPSNINFGKFLLECADCSTQAGNVGSFFSGFTFDLIITDISDNASGKFVGTSSGGWVYSDVSQITVNWSPLQLGPGTSGATMGDFATTIFRNTVSTGIVAPNSGSIPGETTVQGFVNSTTESVVPEPATLGMVGIALLGLGMIGRRRLSHQ